MPDLDVSDIILSPEFSESLVVLRTTQQQNEFGRAVLTETVVEPAPIGVINPDKPDPNALGQEATLNKSILTVHVYNFRFLGPTDTAQPDKLRWQGVTYIATRVSDWSRYGTGFNMAQFEAISPVGQST